MEKRVDLIAFLSEVVRENTRHYQSDFIYDQNTLQKAAQAYDIGTRAFYWMSRPSGTWCVEEREVFIRGSGAHAIWTYYADEAEHIKAYRVVVTGMEAGKVMGTVHSLDYRTQVQRVLANAVPAAAVTLHYNSGLVTTIPYSDYQKGVETIKPGHGGIEKLRYEAADKLELELILAREHTEQAKPAVSSTRKKPRRPRKPSAR